MLPEIIQALPPVIELFCIFCYYQLQHNSAFDKRTAIPSAGCVCTYGSGNKGKMKERKTMMISIIAAAVIGAMLASAMIKAEN